MHLNACLIRTGGRSLVTCKKSSAFSDIGERRIGHFHFFSQSTFKELYYLLQRVGTVPGPCPKKLHRSWMGLSVVFLLPSEMAIGSVAASMAPCYGQQFCSAERLLRFSLVPGFVVCGACGRRVSCFYCSTLLKHVSSVQCDKRHYNCHYVNMPAVITGWVDDGDM